MFSQWEHRPHNMLHGQTKLRPLERRMVGSTVEYKELAWGSPCVTVKGSWREWFLPGERKQHEEKKVILGIEGILRQAAPEPCPGRQSWGPRRSHAFSPRLCADLQREGMGLRRGAEDMVWVRTQTTLPHSYLSPERRLFFCLERLAGRLRRSTSVHSTCWLLSYWVSWLSFPGK